MSGQGRNGKSFAVISRRGEAGGGVLLEPEQVETVAGNQPTPSSSSGSGASKAGSDEATLTQSMTALCASDLLIVFADLRMGAQHAIHRLEHVAHSTLRYRALDDYDQLRLV